MSTAWTSAIADQQAEVTATSLQLSWSPVDHLGTAKVVVSGPNGFYAERWFENGASTVMPLTDVQLRARLEAVEAEIRR